MSVKFKNLIELSLEEVDALHAAHPELNDEHYPGNCMWGELANGILQIDIDDETYLVRLDDEYGDTYFKLNTT
jgi:hypothetical protein